ncbi:uncharacterized protein LOC104906279 [Beta vulgaris subsp. vulgaris]|uniref:uncharacterized protein LOC104906279 n=1 Tax=Beta vulgaris subsp. vulgaris TaxID=3555 RepID=UPI0020373A2D|nr:uncharacterized protein LOC104906279 [Beta vulgaris subsp. vulgaris]
MAPINQCLQSCGLGDITSTGCLYTWNNKQSGNARVFSKLDRILVNEAWGERYEHAAGKFLQEGEFDHTPAILAVYPQMPRGRCPFKYFTMWRLSSQFIDIVSRNWQVHVQGTKMYAVVQKMKKIKKELKELNRVGFHDIEGSEIKAHQEMVDAQLLRHQDPENIEHANAEIHAVEEYKVKHQALVEFIQQRAKVDWVKGGDEITKLFHRSIRARRVQNNVYAISDMNGVWRDKPEEISEAFLSYYKYLLGTSQSNRRNVYPQIVKNGPLINETHKRILMAP